MKKCSSVWIVMLSFVVFLSSCSRNSKRNDELFSMLSEGMENSSNCINASTGQVLHTLQDKLNEFSSRDKASIWFPNAKLVANYTANLSTYLKEIKAKENISNQEATELYNKLIKYRTSLFDIDSSIKEAFESNLILFSRSFDTTANQADIFYKTFFKDISHEASLAMLNRFQNNIMTIENRVTNFCNQKVGDTYDGIDYYIPLISQNSTILRPNEKLKVYAGVGSFMTIVKPTVYVNGYKLEINVMGFAEYEQIALSKPGKYSIPVLVTYTDQFGRNQTATKAIEYTVAKECDQ